jgi:hypothetical protein
MRLWNTIRKAIKRSKGSREVRVNIYKLKISSMC